MFKKSILLMFAITLCLLWGCKDNGTDPKPDPLKVSFEVTNVSEYGGSDGEISLTVTGGTSPCSYSWSNGDNTKDIADLTTGIYKVTITDSKDDSIIDSVEVTQPEVEELNLSFQTTNVSEYNNSDGAIDLTVTGGLMPYTYSWSNGAITEDISNLTADTYEVTVTDAESSNKTGSVVITRPDPTELILSFNITGVGIFGGSDGSINLTVSGGAMPYTYAWSNGATSEDIDNLTAGIYFVTVTDQISQSITDTVEVTQPDEIITGTITDIDGNIYQTVLIGNQWWMTENLKVTHDPQGNSITSCYYNNSEDNLNTYGRLYTWNEAMNGSITEGAQGIAPDGWHIPSVADWQELISYLGGTSIAGGKMKETGTSHWNSPNNATNSSGMTILPGGEKENGVYKFLGQYAVIWSSKQVSSTQAQYYTLKNNEIQIVLRTWSKSLSYSIRCVKDH